jgi:hypothetical protein
LAKVAPLFKGQGFSPDTPGEMVKRKKEDMLE